MFSLKKIIFNEFSGVASAAFVIAAFSLASKILGLIRDRILAGYFGAGDTLDIYYAAFRIPDTIFNLLIVGALSASFVPILSDYFYKGDKKRAWEITNNILNIFLAAIAVISAVLVLTTPYLLKFVVPGWSGEKFQTTVILTQIMFLSPVFLSVSSIMSGVLQSTKRFVVYAAAPIFYNAGIIIGAVVFAKIFALGVYGLVLGVILGSALHFFVQLPAVVSLGYGYRFYFDYQNPVIRKIFRIMVPRTLSLGVGQINLFVITSVASTLATGSLTIFNFAANIQSIFFGMIGVSFGVAAFPTISAYFASGQKEKFAAAFSRTFREIVFLIVPATAYLIIFKAEIVRLIFGTGKFDYPAVILTERTLEFLAIGLTAQALISLVVRAFWAAGDTKTPFYASLFGMVINAIAAVWFSRSLGVAGLAIAFSLNQIVSFIILVFYLRKKADSFDEKEILVSFGKVLGATLISGVIVWFLMGLFPLDLAKMSGSLALVRLSLGSLAILAVFLFFSRLMKIKELFIFTDGIKRRLFTPTPTL
ncbi:murein biosynthesis integral membrane protein MurJ [Patescibacteria group bacterium]|nr:murein biosynthesis integral membrane protein MurJ [Patescibacteria group bacterium]MBU4057063.1 murein biosynthesis integral membrane protein MurJ [Patescibacteria group bacterium]MBU4368694.1 murein biosynthesis integral membrane protein MurJ [Patescibacteria group bacterium]